MSVLDNYSHDLEEAISRAKRHYSFLESIVDSCKDPIQVGDLMYWKAVFDAGFEIRDSKNIQCVFVKKDCVGIISDLITQYYKWHIDNIYSVPEHKDFCLIAVWHELPKALPNA